MVFFDQTRTTPYNEWEVRTSRGALAETKYAGENYVEHLMQRFYIARVSWLYGKQGDSFIHKNVRAADAKGALDVVADEIDTPTDTEDCATALLQHLQTGC